MKRLIVFRHARVLKKGLCYGRFDPDVEEVTDELDLPIKRLKRLQNEGATLSLVSSRAARCLKVARVLSEGLGLAMKFNPRIAELSMGDWEGRLYSELDGLPEFSDWMQNWQTTAPPGGEAIPQLERRVEEFLCQLSNDGYTVVVSHAGVVRCLRVLLETKTWSDAMNEPIPHLTPIEFEVTPEVDLD